MMYHNEDEGADIIPMLAQNMCNEQLVTNSITLYHKLITIVFLHAPHFLIFSGFSSHCYSVIQHYN